MIWQDMRVRITVKIPEGTKLYIRNFDADFGAPAERSLVGIRYNSHLGLIGYIPDNTLESFTMAADVGYAACIVVPKVTKDGVFVCLHDDTINRTGRDKDGNELPEEPMHVWDMTYEELLEYDFAVRKHPIFKGTKIPLLGPGFRMVVFSVLIMIIVLFFRKGIMGTREISVYDGFVKLKSLFSRKGKAKGGEM